MFPVDARGHIGKQFEQLLQQVTTLRQDVFLLNLRGHIGKQLEQLLQQVTTLRQDTASSRPMRTKSCLLGNNKIQRFAFDMFPADARGYMGKQLEQLLQQVTTLRQDIASSRPMQTKGAARETTMNNASPWTRFLLVVLAKRCILLFTLQQDCKHAKRVGCY